MIDGNAKQGLAEAELVVDLTDSLAVALARARLEVARGNTEEAIARLEQLCDASGRHTFLPASLMLGEIYRDRGDVEAAVQMFRLVEDGVGRLGLCDTALNLGLAWQSIDHPGCARKIYSDLVRDFPFECLESALDNERARIAAIAAYRLGFLTAGDNLDEAWTWWQRALDSGVPEVAPLAALALAIEVGSARLYPARIEELFRQVVDFDDLHASPRAAVELGKLFIQRLQFSQAEEYLGYAIESEHPRWSDEAEKVRRRLRRIGPGSSGPVSSQLHCGSLRQDPAGERRQTTAREKKRRVLLVGAGTGGQYLLESMRRSNRPYEVCGFVDDEATELPAEKKVKSLGKIAELPEILSREDPHEVYMAIPTAPGAVRARVVRACTDARIQLQNLPTMHELHHDRELLAQLRPVRIEEICGANPVLIDRDALSGVRDQCALLVGAAGTIGSALAHRLASGQVKHLLLLDRNEACLDRLTRELMVERKFSRVFPVLGDAYYSSSLERAFELHQPSQVFFTAGSAHPGLFEDNVVSAARDEVLGAVRVARIAAANATAGFLYVSSTYAAAPTSAFAAAKALAELAVLAAGEGSSTRFATLRVGSLFRSPGSPVEIFERQIELGGPVTVPDAEVARRFLTGPRVAELCLRAARIAEPGQRLAIDAGKPLNLRELATEMVRLAGGMVDIDLQVNHAPMPGEWPSSDEIAGGDERPVPTRHTDLVALEGRCPGPVAVGEAIDRFRRVAASRDPLTVRRTLLELAEELCEQPAQRQLSAGSDARSNLVN